VNGGCPLVHGLQKAVVEEAGITITNPGDFTGAASALLLYRD